MSGHDDKTDAQLISDLLVVARRASSAKRRLMVRKLYGIAGGANAKGRSEMVELFRDLAQFVASMGTRSSNVPATDRIRWERCNWTDLGDLLRILDHLSPPSGITAADLYHAVLAYLERNGKYNHDRRYRAWASRGEPMPHDPYGCDRFICGEWLAVPPGEGGGHAA